MNRALARAGLVLVALGNAEVAIWGLVGPHSFYSTFPGFGRHWVAPLGTYNEHLLRDYAAAELGFAVLLVFAAVWFGRRLVLASGFAFLAATLPHFAYHLTTTDHLPAADNVASLGSFVLEMALVVFAMVVVARPQTELKEPQWHASNQPSRAVST
jgi:hypothetical protein